MKKQMKFLVGIMLFVLVAVCSAENKLSPKEDAYLRLYEEAITALAKGRAPVYEIGVVDKKVLCEAFLHVLNTGKLDQIEEDVLVASGEKFKMERVSPEDFGLDFGRGVRVRYYLLVGKGEKHRVIIGPSMANKPVMFLPSKK